MKRKHLLARVGRNLQRLTVAMTTEEVEQLSTALTSDIDALDRKHRAKLAETLVTAQRVVNERFDAIIAELDGVR